MANKRFSINTEPHVAEIGDDLTLKFRPEAGSEFLDAYEVLLESQKDAGEDAGAAKRRIADTREFLAGLALPESAAKLRDPEVSIPLRVVTQLVEWLTATYTGSDDEASETKGARPTTRR